MDTYDIKESLSDKAAALKRKPRMGYAICGSFCTVFRSLEQLEQLSGMGWEIIPIVSEAVYTTDTRFGKASDIIARVEQLCGRQVIHTVREAEPLGPTVPLDLLVIAPCTGNTISKMACGITDGAVTMAAKAHARRLRPTVIALATNDALSGSLGSIATVSARKNIYFVPLGQDDPERKPCSLVCDFSLLQDTMLSALSGIQLQPVLRQS